MKHIIPIIAVIIVLISCKGETKFMHHPVHKDVKDYFYYKPGSYWVMRDSLTGRMDSFAVVHSESIVYSTPDESGEVIYCGMHQYRQNTPGEKDSVLLRLSNGWTVSIDFFSAYKYAYSYMTFGGFRPEDSLVGDFTILNRTYKNVQISNPYAVDSNNKPVYGSKFYVNKTEGLLKMVLPQTDQKYVWELLRSKVIR